MTAGLAPSPVYRPPLRAIDRALGVVGLDEVLTLSPWEDLSRHDAESVLTGFARFAAEVLAPTNRIGDAEPPTLDPATGTVTVPEPVRTAYRRWVDDGWSGLGADAEHGGGGLPAVVALAAEEMFAASNLGLSLNPMLTQGAVHLLSQWGSPAQQAQVLPKLVSGEWTGTMNLTEPDAGSDVGAVRTQARPLGDGRWSITGTKIFITWGEHDLTDNIVHLVLARTPHSPEGIKGLSLFLVHRNHIATDGSPGERNGVRCTGLEHKLGIHASPTCVIEFDEAVGELVGPENGGMAAMFTMMNHARLSVGLEGLAISERAYQQAREYAQERRQGQRPDPVDHNPVAIIEHPDIRRMLLTMRTGIEAMRLLLYSTAIAHDLARHHPDEAARQAASVRGDLLTPLAKAWSTDEGVRLTSLAVQIHGGMGYVEEIGAAQHYRDARIAPIYEGTNGIQAIDLVSRKVRRDGGAAMNALIAELAEQLPGLALIDTAKTGKHHLETALDALRTATEWILAAEETDDWLAGATPYLDLASLTVGGALLAKRTVWARHHRPGTEVEAAVGHFTFFALERLALAPALVEAITAGRTRVAFELLDD